VNVFAEKGALRTFLVRDQYFVENKINDFTFLEISEYPFIYTDIFFSTNMRYRSLLCIRNPSKLKIALDLFFTRCKSYIFLLDYNSGISFFTRTMKKRNKACSVLRQKKKTVLVMDHYH